MIVIQPAHKNIESCLNICCCIVYKEYQCVYKCYHCNNHFSLMSHSVISAQPEIQGIAELVDQLNVDNDLHPFCRELRQHYFRICNKEQQQRLKIHSKIQKMIHIIDCVCACVQLENVPPPPLPKLRIFSVVTTGTTHRKYLYLFVFVFTEFFTAWTNGEHESFLMMGKE